MLQTALDMISALSVNVMDTLTESDISFSHLKYS